MSKKNPTYKYWNIKRSGNLGVWCYETKLKLPYLKMKQICKQGGQEAGILSKRSIQIDSLKGTKLLKKQGKIYHLNQTRVGPQHMETPLLSLINSYNTWKSTRQGYLWINKGFGVINWVQKPAPSLNSLWIQICWLLFLWLVSESYLKRIWISLDECMCVKERAIVHCNQ